MIYVCICENNKMTSRKYRELLINVSRKHNIQIDIQCFQSGEALLDAVKKFMADIIYMDVHLEGMNGIETARQLQLYGYQTSLIFLTNSKKHVYEAFEVRPVKYLIKGKTTQEEFERVFVRAVELSMQKRKELLLCNVCDSNIAVPKIDIAYIKVSKRLITVHYKDTETRFNGNLEKLANQLQDHSFFRIHRSYIVNLLHITTFCSHHVVLQNGKELPVGITYANGVKKAFLNLYQKN
ncbi:LytR/AlgR family response regulator transcription factor [Desulfotomaculum sp. 1211_IL3151]|uniref:LytR/AlgR family response regulator transcription factor n=1 Tax=Desulfotomaculum sp. 1211_IL3151 TaxID=3084055 RepID=UPI002FDAB375